MSYELMSDAVDAITTRLNDLYIQYYNDFLTVERFANYHGISVADMQKLVDLGRHINHNELWIKPSDIDQLLEDKWREFANIGIDDNDLIEADFWHWEKGEDLSLIWLYFDEKHSKGLAWMQENVKC